MAKIKLTKNELKKQKDRLKMFQKYLPTLILKKQQLQVEIQSVLDKRDLKRKEQQEIKNKLDEWIELFGEELGLENLVELDYIKTGRGNIAGVDIPVFEAAKYKEVPYDLFIYPLWVDKALIELKRIVTCDLEVRILEEQAELLNKELRTTTQRVNLFEKLMIPEAKTSIKKINIYLGDQQTAAVVRGKIAKSNLVKGS